MGILSILASLLIVGIPIGSSVLEIINIIIYILGLLIIIYFGLIKKNDKCLIIFSVIYLVILMTLVGIIEVNYTSYNLIAIGFIIGLLLSIVGLVNSNKNKNKYKIRISVIVNVIGLIISFLSFVMIFFNDSGIIIENGSDCDYMTGGGYNIFFDTNSDIVLGSMHVCIACSPDSYEALPIINRDKYTFMGWYYDKGLKNKVNVSSTMDIDPVPDKDAKGCLVGYKDIKLYAKWEKVE